VSLLRRFSTIKIGGTAEKIIWLSELPKDFSVLPQPIRILGNGSNVLMNDAGLVGTIVLTREDSLPDIQMIEEKNEGAIIEVPSGIFLPTLAKWTSSRGLSGCEYMVGVPGTLGGALIQNAGANDQELKDVLESVERIDLTSGISEWITATDCQLSYRKSRFQSESVLITKLRLKLRSDDPREIEARLQRNLSYRKQKTPFAKPSLGSMYTRLPVSGGGWLFPGQLIEEAGLKGFQQGNVQISDQHANYFVNLGGASFDEVRRLMDYTQDTVLNRLGAELIPEVQIWAK